MLILSVAAGGAVGAVLRHVIVSNMVFAFPYGTILVNVLGSALLGVVYAHASSIHPTLEAGIRVGLLGALTTFSAFSLDAFGLLEKGYVVQAMLYIFSSVLLSIGAFALMAVVFK